MVVVVVAVKRDEERRAVWYTKIPTSNPPLVEGGQNGAGNRGALRRKGGEGGGGDKGAEGEICKWYSSLLSDIGRCRGKKNTNLQVVFASVVERPTKQGTYLLSDMPRCRRRSTTLGAAFVEAFVSVVVVRVVLVFVE